MIQAGYCTHPERVVLGSGSWQPCRFPAMVGVIEHPTEGLMLFDTGYSERFHAETSQFPNVLYARLTPVHYRPEDSALTQLDALGYRAEDVRHVILSHFHGDHIAALGDFPSARFYCSEDGYSALRSLKGFAALTKGFLPGLLPADFARRLKAFEAAPPVDLAGRLGPFKTGYDLFGDGMLVAVPLPGHADGHYGLLVESEKGPVFLVGDACWTSRSFTELRLPSAVAQLIFSDKRAYAETLSGLHALSQERPEVLIVPSHCQELWESFERETQA
jgi:glyoxylase-like metal-dependent hydrolase (beta-lactamase superfamily II)